MKKLVLAVLLLVGTAAYADNLSFIGPTANGEYGPYTMSLNGTATQMICFSGENWISASEGSWSVVAYTSTTVVGPVSGTAFAGSSAQYNELGYLANELFADPGDPNLQLAIWSVLGLSGTFGTTTQSNKDVTDASNAVNKPDGYVTSDLFYIPIATNGDPLPFVNGTTPQPFIAETPEPSSLALLVAGMLALMLLMIRRGRA